ncbi:MAG: hypothetical protein K2X27_28480 [Candidatus Obscuribacterales bacterium]|nr:hypothetical protein [Candidatus Obscuribacterales bacterium]
MFQEAPVCCKKCPAAPYTEQEKAFSEKLNASAAAISEKISSSIESSSAGERTTAQSKSIFFGVELDDRSTAVRPYPIARYVLLPLLIVHILSQTPGIGSAGPLISEFVISKQNIKAQESGLKFS